MINIEVANTMLGPSSYFHVRVFSLSFHTSMMTYVTDIASELLPCKSSGGGSVHFLVRRPSFTFSPEIGRKRLPCKPAGFSILTSTVKGQGVDGVPPNHPKSLNHFSTETYGVGTHRRKSPCQWCPLSYKLVSKPKEL